MFNSLKQALFTYLTQSYSIFKPLALKRKLWNCTPSQYFVLVILAYSLQCKVLYLIFIRSEFWWHQKYIFYQMAWTSNRLMNYLAFFETFPISYTMMLYTTKCRELNVKVFPWRVKLFVVCKQNEILTSLLITSKYKRSVYCQYG